MCYVGIRFGSAAAVRFGVVVSGKAAEVWIGEFLSVRGNDQVWLLRSGKARCVRFLVRPLWPVTRETVT